MKKADVRFRLHEYYSFDRDGMMIDSRVSTVGEVLGFEFKPIKGQSDIISCLKQFEEKHPLPNGYGEFCYRSGYNVLFHEMTL